MKWVFRSIPYLKTILDLATLLNIRKPLATLLVQRSIFTFDQAKRYFRPALEDLHDPFLMDGMEKAVDRLNSAIQNQEKILIYGDYDVDGTTAVALVYSYLSSVYPNIAYYIPDRYSEGYGISESSIDFAAENNFNLVISLDCGIKAKKLIENAANKGIDFIVCDHHTPGKTLPPAVAVLDPKKENCHYPYKELSGCGIGFKLLQGFSQRFQQEQVQLFQYLDLIAVSIAADIVPITGENRVLTYHGLKILNQNARPGLKALMKLAGQTGQKIDVMGVVFGIAPRINAAGRMEHAHNAVQMLLAETEEEAYLHAGAIDNHNTQRKDFDKSITHEAISMIEQDPALMEAKSTVLFKEDWHKGVIGIVASRCIEKYYRPTIILTESNEKITGSARSVKDFNVYEAIDACADLLDQYGGHNYAAGLTLSPDNVEAFKAKFEEEVTKRITDDQLIPKVEIDLEISLDIIDYRLINIIQQMAPFGPGNLQPVFAARSVKPVGMVQLLKEAHLKFKVTQHGFEDKQGNSKSISVIGFRMAEYYPLVESGQPLDIAFHITTNTYNGSSNIQLVLKDIKASGGL